MGGAMSWIQKRVMGDEGPTYEFPTTLEDFGYYFNAEGKLRHKETEEPFVFNVREGDHHYNQKHYNALGEIIEEKVYQMMEKDYKLQRTYVPTMAEEGEPRSFVFISGDLYNNSDKLMILVHGNGVVRAGQWARRLIINDCLDSGTQMPFIKWARENGYAVIVTNPNLNSVEPKGNRKKKPIPIKGNSSPEEHAETVWRELIQRSAAKHIAIVAHSYGGVSTLDLAKNHIREFEERVFAIALTDSVHGLRQQEAEPEVVSYYKQHVVNWASAYDPLDAPLITTHDDVPTVSAGTDRHENTSYSSMHSIFKYFKEKYEETVNPSKKRESANGQASMTKTVTSEKVEESKDQTAGQDAEQTKQTVSIAAKSGQGEESEGQTTSQDAEQIQVAQSDVQVTEPEKSKPEQPENNAKSSDTVEDSSSVPRTEDSEATGDQVKPDVESDVKSEVKSDVKSEL